MSRRPSRSPQAHPMLLLEDRGATLMDGEGSPLVQLPPLKSGPEGRLEWVDLLRPHVTPGSRFQFILGHSNLHLICQDAPYLAPRDLGVVAQRLAAAEMGAQAFNFGARLLADPDAEGGNQLWVGAHPSAEMADWLWILHALKSEIGYAVPLAFLLGQVQELHTPGEKDRLLVLVESSGARLLFFRGQGLVFSRTFRLPEGLDPGQMGDADEEILVEVLSEELNRVLQYIKQKHRGVQLKAFHVLGLPDLSGARRSQLERTLRMPVEVHGEPVLPRILEALRTERHSKAAFNMVPQEVLEARRMRLLRAGSWLAAGMVGFICVASFMALRMLERQKTAELAQAEVSRDQRRARHDARELELRKRFPKVRFLAAASRCTESSASLERLALELLDPPPGIELHRVEIAQIPGAPVAWSFSVQGSSLTGATFSVGPLATYLGKLRRHPGLTLAPLGEVSVSDRRLADGRELLDQRAVSRFSITGVSP